MDNSNEKVGSQNRLIHKSFRKARTIDFLTGISNIALPPPKWVDKFDKKCYNVVNLIYSGYAFWDSSPTQIIVNKSTALKEIHLKRVFFFMILWNLQWFNTLNCVQNKYHIIIISRYFT